MLTNHGSIRCTIQLHQPILVAVVELHASRAMHALYGLLRGNHEYCGGKRTDVIEGELDRPIIERTCIVQRRNAIDDEHRYRNWFFGKTILAIGDPSRNVIEMIFRSTTTNTTRRSINIKQVLKLNNSWETLEKFEMFRECVKNKSFQRHNNHPRSIVDGNEQLLFYGTKLPNCKRFGSSKICRDSNCSICSIIKSGFCNVKKKSGIWLNTNCEDIINDDMNLQTKNVKMAILVCRVIVGRVVDVFDRNHEGEYDSITGVKPNYMFVKNPNAALPCFVIILSHIDGGYEL